MSSRQSNKNKARKVGFVEVTILFTSFIAATYGFGVYLFSTILPDMKVDLDFSYTQAGGMISLAQVGFLIAALTSSFLTHKVGAQRLILLSMLTCCISLIGMIFVSTAWQVALLLAVAGAAAAAVWVPMVAVAQDMIPMQHHGKAIGLMSSGTAYGVFVNGLAVPMLLPVYGWRSVWLLAAVLACLFWIWACLRLIEAGNEASASTAVVDVSANRSFITFSELIEQPAILLILGMMLLNGIACMPAQNYLISYLRDDLGYDVAMAARAWSIIGLIGMIGGFIMGSLADKISVQKSLTFTYLLLGVATALFLSHINVSMVYLGAAIFGVAFNAIFGLVPAYVSLNFSKNTATLIFGLATVLLGVGSMVGNFAGGLIHDHWHSFSMIYQISTGIALVLAFLSFLLGRLRNSGRMAAQSFSKL